MIKTIGMRLSTLNALANTLDVPKSLFFKAPYEVIWDGKKKKGEIKNGNKN